MFPHYGETGVKFIGHEVVEGIIITMADSGPSANENVGINDGFIYDGPRTNPSVV